MKYVFYKDGKFLTGLVDAVVSTILYFVGKYAAPGVGEDINFVIALYQPLIALLILGMYQTEQAIVTRFQQHDSPAFLPPSFMVVGKKR